MFHFVICIRLIFGIWKTRYRSNSSKFSQKSRRQIIKIHIRKKTVRNFTKNLTDRYVKFVNENETLETVLITFYIPNAFSPNGDKINDYFYGSGVGVIKYDLWIFDRWGDMVFHAKDINDKWDGKSNGGSSESQIDTYVWKVTLTDVFDKEHNYTGIVSIVK